VIYFNMNQYNQINSKCDNVIIEFDRSHSECDNVISEFDRSHSVYWTIEKFYEKLIFL